VARAVLLALIGAGFACAQLLPPPPPDPNPPKYEVPPEEDESLATPKVYTFNPLQAKKEVSTGDFYMKRGNFKGAAYRYREATHWDDGSADAFFKLGEASEKLKDYPTAREAFEKFAGMTADKKKASDARKRIAKYPAAASTQTKKGLRLDEALKEDRGDAATIRSKGIIQLPK
jgi:tetratricopeptide (TPR) repeat protein